MNHAVRFGAFELRPRQRVLLRDGAPCRLGDRALDILLALVERAGEIVPAEALVARVWAGVHVDDSALRVHLSALRKVLDERTIITVAGRGYSFVATLTVIADATATAPAPTASALDSGALPVALTAAIGRATDVEALARALDEHRLVSILGPGGIGKTTAALMTGRRLEAQGQTVRFIDLTPADPAAPLAGLVAAGLGVPMRSADPLAELTGALRGRDLLLVLDNCEHVIEAAALLAETLLRGCPGLRLLTTSREPLRADGERNHRLAPLAAPEADGAITADEAMGYSAVALFVERARAASGDFVLDDLQAPVVVEICRRLDGLPLAIELAAARIGALGPAQIAERLDDRFALLTQGRRTALPRQQTLEAALDWSHDLLEPGQQTLLRRLSVFAGRFGADAAAEVAGFEADHWSVLEDLGELVAKSLVAADPSVTPAAYRLLESTRAFARERLAQAGEDRTIAARHAAHVRTVFERADAEWSHERLDTWRGLYGARLDDLRAALRWWFGPDGDDVEGALLAASSAKLWLALLLLGEFRPWLELALERVTGRDRLVEMRLATLFGHITFETGLTPAVQEAFERALALAEEAGDPEARFAALVGMFKDRTSNGDYQVGVALADEVGAAGRAIGRLDAELYRTRLRAMALHYAGDQYEAERLTRQILANPNLAANETGESFHFDPLVFARAAWARILWLRGDHDFAAAEANDLIAGAIEIDHTPSLYIALVTAGGPVALWNGDTAAVDRHDALVRPYVQQIGLLHWSTWMQTFDLARQARFGTLSLDQATSLITPVIDTLTNYSREMLATNHAGYLCNRILARTERGEGGWCAPEVIRAEAERRRLSGDLEGARDGMLSALSLARHQGALSWELRAATGLARLHLADGRRDAARDLLGPVRDRFRPAVASMDLAAADAVLDGR